MNPSTNNSFGSQPSAISSGAGDVVLPITSSGGSKKRGLIIVAIVLFLVAIGAGVAAVVVMSRHTDGGGTGVIANVKPMFNSYANYILTGKNSDGDVSRDAIYGDEFYADNMLFVSENVQQKEDFLDNLENKYEGLVEVYNGDFDISNIQAYFYDFARLEVSTEDEILSSYLSNGKQPARELVIKNLKIEGVEYNQNFLGFLQAERKLRLVLVEYYDSLNVAGCVVNNTIDDDCADANVTLEENVILAADEAFEAEERLRSMAWATLRSVYDEVYDVSDAGGSR